jgi:predicted CXXCH cytochrome family protein
VPPDGHRSPGWIVIRENKWTRLRIECVAPNFAGMSRYRPMPGSLRRNGCRLGGILRGSLFAAVILALGAGCRRSAADGAQAVGQVSKENNLSTSCRECHPAQFAAWHDTDHARANRLVDPVGDKDALASFLLATGARGDAKPDMVLGNLPLWQPLIPVPGGRWQAHELAFDPHRRDWFNVFGNEERKPGEWGHWTGRGMNWNSMCAHCHMTGYDKGYDPETDTYRSMWLEQGVGCVQCHGPMTGHGAAKKVKMADPMLREKDRQRAMQTCAPCHARNEQLTLDFKPGDNYFDHYRVVLPGEPGVFWPDGQQRDEDFNWSSVLLSRMGHAGVTCMDCHDPHTNKTILPAANNQLCLQCHAAPGRVLASGIRAMPIDPTAHSRHADGSTGNSCVACHMPTTVYMQRAPRHDHGWLKPDPLMTRELGIPNACNRCHADRSVDWAIEWSDKWYGDRLNSTQRARARAVAAAQADQPDAAKPLLALMEREDIPAWRATYLQLLARYVGDERVVAVAGKSLHAEHPLERSAAAQVFNALPGDAAQLQPLLADPVRLVRLDAAWTLSPGLPEGSAARRELDAHLKVFIDQPAGRLRLAQDLANRGRLKESANDLATASSWDPHSPAILDAYAVVLAALGRPEEAAERMRHAAELQPADPGAALRAALAFAEANRPEDAEKWLKQSVARDARFDRGWYNLGLFQAQQEHLPEAIASLKQAEALAPATADYPYALSTVLLRSGDRAGAMEAARRALAVAPTHAGARQIIQRLKP